jgi:hypothetical protein
MWPWLNDLSAFDLIPKCPNFRGESLCFILLGVSFRYYCAKRPFWPKLCSFLTFNILSISQTADSDPPILPHLLLNLTTALFGFLISGTCASVIVGWSPLLPPSCDDALSCHCSSDGCGVRNDERFGLLGATVSKLLEASPELSLSFRGS